MNYFVNTLILKLKFPNFRILITLSLLLIFSFSSYSSSVHSICNGNWSDATTWDVGVPSINDTVIVDHYVLLDVDVVLSNPGFLIVNAMGTICGFNTYTGAFTTYGPMYVYGLTIVGNSTNYGSVSIHAGGFVNVVTGAWSVVGLGMFGAFYTCNTTIPCIAPTAGFNIVEEFICVGQNITFSNTSIYSTSNNWLLPGANIITSSSTNPTVHYDLPGIYSVTQICYNTYGSDTLTQTITVVAGPTINLMNDTLVCKNTLLNLSASGIGNFNWSPTTNLSCSNCLNPVFNAINTQNYIVTLTDSNSCVDSDTVTILVSEPSINLDANYFFCIGESITISVLDETGYNFLWSNSSSATSITLNTSQTIYLTVTDTFNCSTTDTAIVIEKNLPNIEIENEKVVCSNKELTLYNSTGIPITNYLWSTGEITETILVSDSGFYSLTITDIYQCKNSDTVKITEENCECNSQHLPNAFTPNQNGSNDYLHVLGDDIILVEFMVYNRYGQQVFYSTSLGDYWDGTFHGKELDPGVFAFLIVGTCKFTGEKIMEKGNVTLIR